MSTRDYRSYGILDKEIAQENQIAEGQALYTNMTLSEKENDRDKSPMQNSQAMSVVNLEKQDNQDNKEEKQNEDIPAVLIEEQDKEDKDTSFVSYKKQNPLRERSTLFKLTSRIVKIAIFLMLLPLICIILAIAAAAIVVVVAVIFSCIAAGVVILGEICFMSSQLSASLVALGVIASIAAFSLAGIMIILSMMFIKWYIGLRKKRRQKKMNKSKGGQ